MSGPPTSRAPVAEDADGDEDLAGWDLDAGAGSDADAGTAEVDPAAVLDERVMRLADAVNPRGGDRIVPAAGPGATVRPRRGTAPLFEGHVGRRKSRVAVCMDREVARTAEA